ncbi:Caldesmon [Labeo rohita]|uniref:Caldesmon n=1 Tax=Labeo rohita TaxID=84645 RepID=A0ABQ8MI46_LABRO|nr:Caldesmon [Labeo rohita]
MKNTWRETEEGKDSQERRENQRNTDIIFSHSKAAGFSVRRFRETRKHVQLNPATTIQQKGIGEAPENVSVVKVKSVLKPSRLAVVHTTHEQPRPPSHSALRTRSSSKLITVQRSLEDAEEIERERRQRARASSSTEPSQLTVTPQDSPHTAQALDNQGQNDLLPSCQYSLEEDEGFSDWTHLSRRKQGQMEHKDVETHVNGSRHSKLQLCSSSAQQSKLHDINVYDSTPSIQTRPPLSNQQNLDEDNGDEDWGAREQTRRDDIKAAEREERETRRWCAEEDDARRVKGHESSFWKKQNESCDMDEKREKKAEMKISYTSTVILQQNGRQYSTNGQEGRRTNDSVSEEVFEKSSEENQQHTETEDQTHEEVQRRLREQERERKRKDVMEKLKRLSISSGDPEEPFSPLSPKSPSYMAEGEEWQSEGTSSITERTESLNRSVKKKNSIKKTQPPTIISKLDGRLEQYNHAIEVNLPSLLGEQLVTSGSVFLPPNCQEICKSPMANVRIVEPGVTVLLLQRAKQESCKEGNAAKVMDVPTPPEPVSARKTLFEAGEAWNQNSTKAVSSKDTEGMKVGVTDLINQWVKGNCDVKSPSSKGACQEVKAGEVRNIKSMWENLGDSSPQDKSCAKGSTGKRYKFVESGHGKYEKVLINSDTN